MRCVRVAMLGVSEPFFQPLGFLPSLDGVAAAPLPFYALLTLLLMSVGWSARCSVTSFILSTPMVRTCIGCSRKAFLPSPEPSNGAESDGPHSGVGLPAVARSWVVEELLGAVHRCLFCGNSFVSVL
jgi:Putative zinc-finger of transcription factor IIIC complex